MITLYIKTHNITGLKYFGMTKNTDIHKYQGSGLYWQYHIKKHGYDVTTEIYASFENDCIELNQLALEFSKKYDIVNSSCWANLIPESGRGNSILEYNKTTRERMSKPKSAEGLKNIREAAKKRRGKPTWNKGLSDAYTCFAKTIHIFDNKNNLLYVCYGNFVKTCKDNNLPTTALIKSYRANGVPIFTSNRKCDITRFENDGRIHFKGWYAKILD